MAGEQTGLPAQYPWYDGTWLWLFHLARGLVAAKAPRRLAEFETAFRPMATDPSFEERRLPDLFDASTADRVRRLAETVAPERLEHHEIGDFGRMVVHDHPFFTELQHQLVERVSVAVGEPVEPCYNFLSYYGAHGVCDVHLDSPEAKWTVDYCIDHVGESWPLWVGRVRPWPAPMGDVSEDWAARITTDPTNRFEPYDLGPGEALVFAGSSQWHYRRPRPDRSGSTTLLFFHFVPRGTAELVKPQTWAERFDLDFLSVLGELYERWSD